MKYLSIVLTAVMGLFFTQTVVAQSDSELPKSKVISRLTLPVGIGFNDKVSAIKTDTVIFLLSKKQIEERLEKLVINPPHIQDNYHKPYFHVWYTVAYTCPKCGGKTFYENPKREWVFDFWKEKFIWNGYNYVKLVGYDNQTYEYAAYMIRDCRAHLQKIKGIHVALDESEFCEHCSPFIAKPTLYLLVNIEGEPDTTRIANVSPYDIQLLQFLNKDFFHVFINHEKPQTNYYIERIKELLGLTFNH